MWEKQEISLQAGYTHRNPYPSVDTRVDLKGRGFNNRVSGFWDGERTFRVGIVATGPGQWPRTRGSNPPACGLAGKTGSFSAAVWSVEEKQANPNRRSFFRATRNGHALEYAGGLPYLLVGDTAWMVGAWRYPPCDDPRHSHELSRPFPALDFWLRLESVGTRARSQAIEDNIACAEYFAELVRATGDFKMPASVDLSVFCFRNRPLAFACDLDVLNERILEVQRDGGCYHSCLALRGCVLSCRTTSRDIEILLGDVRQDAHSIT